MKNEAVIIPAIKIVFDHKKELNVGQTTFEWSSMQSLFPQSNYIKLGLPC